MKRDEMGDGDGDGKYVILEDFGTSGRLRLSDCHVINVVDFFVL